MSEKPTTKQPDNGHELLAAELSLGVLEGQALSDALARKETDRAFAAEVEAWSLRLAPLAEALTEHAPPARLKQRIEAHVFGEEARTSTSEPARLWTSLSFWRAATALFAATTVVAGVISLVGGPAPEPERAPAVFAALQADPAAASVLIRFDPETRQLTLAGPLTGEDSTPVQPELWVIPPGGAPQSLGLIAQVEGVVTADLSVDPDLAKAIQAGATLAISLEPPGGSPTGAPTGPVVAAGGVRSL